MWNPFLGQKVRWQPTPPEWRRLKVPKGAAVVLEARRRGRDAASGVPMPRLPTIVVPPDRTYDS